MAKKTFHKQRVVDCSTVCALETGFITSRYRMKLCT